MLYDIGDEVRVHDNLQVGQRYKPMPFLEKMKKFRGHTVTIADKDILANAYLIEEDGQSSFWTDEMFIGDEVMICGSW